MPKSRKVIFFKKKERENSGPTQVAKGIFIEEICLLSKVLWDSAPIFWVICLNETALVFYL